MKRYMISLGLLLIVGLLGCSEMEISMEERRAAVRLSLKVDCQNKDSRSREIVGVEGENENSIHHLDCFFYTATSDESAPAVLRISRDFTGDTGTTLVEDFLSTAQIDALFPAGVDQCKVYVLANLPQEVVLPVELPSVASLKKMVITQPLFDQNVAPADFVMDSSGEDVMTLFRSAETVSGAVVLARAAAKITLSITKIKEVVETDAEGNEVTWTANPAEMRVFLNHGVWRRSEERRVGKECRSRWSPDH